MLALLALTSDEEKAGYDTVSGTASLDVEKGKNKFVKQECGLHKYAIKKEPDQYYKNIINSLLKKIILKIFQNRATFADKMLHIW